MSATSSPIADPVAPPRLRSAAEPPAPGRHDLRRRLLTVLVLGACVVTVLLAVPDLRPVVREITDMNPALVVAAIALELASCLCFVVIFRLFFRPIPKAAAREMAWSQMGSGALLPGGGIGSLAVGGWLLHIAGMPTRQIVQRSSGLFFLTIAINVLTLGVGQGIGVLDAGLVGALTLYGSPVAHAAAAVLVYHTIAFWIPTLGGMLAYARLRPRLARINETVNGNGIPDRLVLLEPGERASV